METDAGDWTDRLFADVQAEDPDGFAGFVEGRPDFAFPGGESFAQQGVRVAAALADVEQGATPSARRLSRRGHPHRPLPTRGPQGGAGRASPKRRAGPARPSRGRAHRPRRRRGHCPAELTTAMRRTRRSFDKRSWFRPPAATRFAPSRAMRERGTVRSKPALLCARAHIRIDVRVEAPMCAAGQTPSCAERLDQLRAGSQIIVGQIDHEHGRRSASAPRPGPHRSPTRPRDRPP